MVSTRSISDIPEGPLVSTTWLDANLDNPRVRVLDVRGRHPSSSLPPRPNTPSSSRHVPGAAFVDWEHDFVACDDPVPVQVASPRGVRGAPGRSASATATWW